MKKNNGFTLIELLAVVAILAILSTIGVVIFKNIQTGARDAQRLRDLNSIKQTLEFYRNDYRSYPPALDDSSFASKYLREAPNDPLGAGRSYQYKVNSDRTSFILCALKEGTNNFGMPSGCSSLTCNANPSAPCNMGLSSD